MSLKKIPVTARFGAHMSIAGGVWNAIDRGREVGCDVVQVFTKSTGQWAAKPIGAEEARLFRERAAATGVRPVAAHAAYLLNIASPAAALHRRSTAALRDELERCEALGIPCLVLHPGAHMGAGEESGIRAAAQALDGVHASTRGFRARVLLEVTAGQGSTLGYRFEHLGEILDRVKEPERLGICLDTCHLLAAGYEIRTAAGYAETVDALERHAGAARVHCIHANDSKRDLGSRVDRHEHIGKGHIGPAGFRRILRDPRFRAVPVILETPKVDDMDRVNLAALRKLAGVRAAPLRRRRR